MIIHGIDADARLLAYYATVRKDWLSAMVWTDNLALAPLVWFMVQMSWACMRPGRENRDYITGQFALA